MKKSSTLFLQAVIILIGIGSLTLLLWVPQLEGRNVNATLFEIYFKDPFLAYAYTGSIAFFVALYQGFKILGHVRENKTFSPATVKAFKTIKYCAMTLIGFIVGAEAYLWIVMRGQDDITGGVAMGLLLLFGSVIIATVAAVLEKTVQNAVELKSKMI